LNPLRKQVKLIYQLRSLLRLTISILQDHSLKSDHKNVVRISGIDYSFQTPLYRFLKHSVLFMRGSDTNVTTLRRKLYNTSVTRGMNT